MDSQFITIPSKKADMVDWVHSLKSFFRHNYGSYEDFSEEINQFNKLSLNAKSCNRDSVGRDILYRYYGQLELFDLRIPVDDHSGVHVEFTWYDAFKDSKSVTQNSIAFEKLCILFNLAGTLSEIGSIAMENHDYKTSCQSLQYSAGVYKFISENFLNAPSNDLQQETIRAFEQLMLSQAQELFLLRILNGDGPIKSSLLSKLAKSASNLYTSSRELLEKISEIDLKWINYCKLKAKLYNSILYYHQAQALKDSSKNGEAIAFMKQAQVEIEDYKSNYVYSTYTSLETNSKKMIDLIKLELPILEKDNDYIYHDSIPVFNTLTLKGLDGVKSIPLNDQGIDKIVGKDIFEKIIPYSVQEQSSKYTEMLASLLRSEDEKITVSNEELSSILEYLNLPLKLNEIKVLVNSTNSESDSKMKEISGKDYNTQELSDNLNKLKKNCNDKLNDLNKTIDLNSLQYNDKMMDIRENISKTRQSLISANETDIKINNLIKPYEKELSILRSGQISSYLQNDKSLLDIDFNDEELEKIIIVVDKILSDLNNLKYEKGKTYKSLRDAVHNDDISKILILNKNAPDYNDIFQNELAKFKPYQDRIELLNSKQQELISSLKRNFKNLLTNQNYINLSQDKTNYDTNVSNLLKTVEQFAKFKNGYTQAMKFYNDLLNFINNLEFEINQILNTAKFSSMNLNYQPDYGVRSPSVASTYSNYHPPQSRQNSYLQPPPLPPQQYSQPRQNSSSIYDQPSSYDPSMYSKFS